MFIQNNSSVVRPLIQLTKKNKSFDPASEDPVTVFIPAKKYFFERCQVFQVFRSQMDTM
jgi:hypothetical protein